MNKPKLTAKASDSKKVFDVAKPGNSAATATSKPVLITNRPVMQDPMVNQPSEGEPTSAPLLVQPKKLVINPIHDDAGPEDTSSKKLPKGRPITELTAASDTESTEHAITVKVKSPAKVEPKPEAKPIETDDIAVKVQVKPAQPAPAKPSEPAKPVETDKSEPASEAAKKDDPQLDPGKVDEVALEAALKAEAEHTEQIQKLVSSEKYFLPTNHLEKRRTKHFVLLGLLLIIVLSVAWGDIALDAGLISTPQNLPHTHFFTSKK